MGCVCVCGGGYLRIRLEGEWVGGGVRGAVVPFTSQVGGGEGGFYLSVGRSTLGRFDTVQNFTAE